jgi:hypothetical protein
MPNSTQYSVIRKVFKRDDVPAVVIEMVGTIVQMIETAGDNKLHYSLTMFDELKERTRFRLVANYDEARAKSLFNQFAGGNENEQK